jgi:hypothetical protein
MISTSKDYLTLFALIDKDLKNGKEDKDCNEVKQSKLIV